MVAHENYTGYTFEEITNALWGAKPGAAIAYDQAWPESMRYAGQNAYQLVKAISDALAEIDKSRADLAAAWKGPAAEGFQRISQGIRDFMSKTAYAAKYPYWWELLSWGSDSMEKAQTDAWNAYQAAWTITPEKKEVVITTVQPTAGRGGATTKTETKTIPGTRVYEEEKALVGMRWAVYNLALAYKAIEPQFTPAPAKIVYPEPPPPRDPQEKIDQLAKKNQADLDKITKKNEDDLKKRDEALKQQQNDANKAKETFDRQLEEAKKPPPGLPGGPDGAKLLKPGPELPGLPSGVGAPVDGGRDIDGDGKADLDKSGRPLPSGVGAPVDGGRDIDGDGKADLDKSGRPLPSRFDPSDPDSVPFTLPGAALPPGQGIPPPVPPPAGTRLPVDADGNLTPGVIGAAGGGLVSPPGGVESPGARNPKFVRSPAFEPTDQPTRLGPPAPNGGSPAAPGRPIVGGGAPTPAGAAARSAGFGGLPVGGLASGAGYPPMMPPMGGMGSPAGMGGQAGERERQTWLLEDDEIWSDDADLGPAVLGRVVKDDEEYAPQF